MFAELPEAGGEREGEAEEEGRHQQPVQPLLPVLGQAPLAQGVVRAAPNSSQLQDRERGDKSETRFVI